MPSLCLVLSLEMSVVTRVFRHVCANAHLHPSGGSPGDRSRPLAFLPILLSLGCFAPCLLILCSMAVLCSNFPMALAPEGIPPSNDIITVDKSGIADRIKEYGAKDPDSLRRLLWHEDWLVYALQGFKARLKAGKRDAIRLYFEAVELVSSKRDAALIMICSDLGVKDIGEGKTLVGMAKRALGSTPDDAYSTAKRICRERIKADPTERIRLRQELFGEREIEEEVAVGPTRRAC